MDNPLVSGLSRLNLSNRRPLADLLNRDLGVNDPDYFIKKWQLESDFYAPHFSMIDIIRHLDKSKPEARKIATAWEDEGLVSVHYRIVDENLARYLFTENRGKEEHDG